MSNVIHGFKSFSLEWIEEMLQNKEKLNMTPGMEKLLLEKKKILINESQLNEKIETMVLTYTIKINKEICQIEGLQKILDETIEEVVNCKVLGSKIESPEEVCETGNIVCI